MATFHWTSAIETNSTRLKIADPNRRCDANTHTHTYTFSSVRRMKNEANEEEKKRLTTPNESSVRSNVTLYLYILKVKIKHTLAFNRIIRFDLIISNLAFSWDILYRLKRRELLFALHTISLSRRSMDHLFTSIIIIDRERECECVCNAFANCNSFWSELEMPETQQNQIGGFWRLSFLCIFFSFSLHWKSAIALNRKWLLTGKTSCKINYPHLIRQLIGTAQTP